MPGHDLGSEAKSLQEIPPGLTCGWWGSLSQESLALVSVFSPLLHCLREGHSGTLCREGRNGGPLRPANLSLTPCSPHLVSSTPGYLRAPNSLRHWLCPRRGQSKSYHRGAPGRYFYIFIPPNRQVHTLMCRKRPANIY